MRITNIIREKIAYTVDKQVTAAINDLYAERRAMENNITKQLAAIRVEADEKAAKILAQYPDACFYRYGYTNGFIIDTANIRFAEDEELTAKADAIRKKAKEIKMDLEIRCQLEKNADAFFKTLEEVKL